MSLHTIASTLTILALAGGALAQAPKAGADHSAHHPPASAASAAAPVLDAFDRQMRAMQGMHQRMQSAQTPAERAALMDEHMKLMQSGMAMTGPMRGSMDMHQQMERRMAMMEQMMQMMVDREAAMPRR